MDGRYVFCFLFLTLYCKLEASGLPQLRNVVVDKSKLWERETLVYQFSSILDSSQRSIVEQSMREIEQDVSVRNASCVSFHRKEGPFQFSTNFVYIQMTGNRVCGTDSVGMKGGRQYLHLSDDCMHKRQIIPLLLLLLGLYHEHQRPDRDQYIQVHMNNVVDEYRSTFEKIPASHTDLLGYPYDFDSITHYGPYNYAKDIHQPTITLVNRSRSFGNKRTLSYRDVMKVQTLYICGHDTSHIINRPALPVNCNFENFLCNLADDYLDEFKWYRQDTPLSHDGPVLDHSIGGGFYLYANGTGQLYKTARLLSAREISPGQYCIAMHYFIMGNTSATLTLRAYDYVLGHESTLSSRSDNHGSNIDGGWYEYLTEYTNTSHKWRIFIECHILNGNGGIAIDDVQVYPGVCS